MNKILICSYDTTFLPEKKTPEAACRDIKCAEEITIAPGEIKLVKSGVKTYIPTGRYCRMYARSSLPLKSGLMLANSVGIIDSDYRGEYLMQLFNCTQEPITITKATRLCQIEFCPHYWGNQQFGTSDIPAIETCVDADLWERFDEEFSSERGSWGFGSTGKN